MFGYNNNNGSNMNRNEINVNSRLKTFMSDDMMGKLGMWNDKLSIRLYRCTGVDGNGLRSYDKNTTAITAMNIDACASLLSLIDNKLIPEMNSSLEPVEYGVDVSNGLSYIGVRAVPNPEDNTPDMHLIVVTNINESGAAQEATQHDLKFTKRRGKKGYNPTTGSYDVEIVNGDFDNFVNILREVCTPYNIGDHMNKFYESFSRNDHYNPSNNNMYGGNNAGNTGFMQVNGIGDEMPFN